MNKEPIKVYTNTENEVIHKRIVEKHSQYEIGDFTIQKGVVWIIVDVKETDEGTVYYFERGD